jgi:hypothetical protein
MPREMRDISGDLSERADLLVKQMVAEQARFQTALTELEREKTIRRQRLETAGGRPVNRPLAAVEIEG